MSGGDEPSPREPQAHCDACGALGTVGRATRYEAPPQVWRFCRACWPAESARLRAAWDAETERWLRQPVRGPVERGAPAPPGSSFDSRVWEDAYELLDLLEGAMARPAPPGSAAPTPADLRAFAAEMQQLAPDMDGPPPPRIAAFLQRYGLPAR
jgi:hypothetical protein